MQKFDRQKVRAHLRQQAEFGFPLLKGCASTAAIRSVAWLEKLEERDRLTFTDQLCDLSYEQWANPMVTESEREALFARYTLAGPYVGRHFGQPNPQSAKRDVRYIPVKVLYGVMNDSHIGGFDGWAKLVEFSSEPGACAPATAHVASFDEIVPVSPRRLRRLIGDGLKERFGATAERVTSDHTRFAAHVPGGNIQIQVLFARGNSATHQFEYYFGAAMDDGRRVAMQNYEDIWRTVARWDYITEANAERSIMNFLGIIETCVELV